MGDLWWNIALIVDRLYGAVRGNDHDAIDRGCVMRDA